VDEERLEAVIAKVRDLFSSRRHREVVAVADSIDPKYILSEPELLLPIAGSLQHLFKFDEARFLLSNGAEAIGRSSNQVHKRRWQKLSANDWTERGQLDEARRLLDDCLLTAELDNHVEMLGHALNGLGIVASLLGNVEEAVSFYTRSMAMWQRVGNRAGVGRAHHNLGVLLREWGRLDESTVHFDLAADFFAAQGTPEERTFTTFERAALLLDVGDIEMAESLARAALTRASDLDSLLLLSAARKSLGAVLLRTGSLEEARELLLAAAKGAEATGNRLLVAEVYEELCIMEVLSEQKEEFQRYRDIALSNFAGLGATKHMQRLEQRITTLHQELGIHR
jgi:tetratricopeptide (TPR) repeat protein